MGFFNYYKKQIRMINEAKQLTPINTYDENMLYALRHIFNDIQKKGDYYARELGYMGLQREDKKMVEYRDKGSNPVRLATSTENLDKLIYRYQWCIENWEDAAEAYKLRIFEIIKDTMPNEINNYLAQKKKKDDEAKKFEEDVNNANTDQYAPKQRDWEKMIGYLNKKSNPERVAQSCKDANKVISRFVIAKALHWDECVKAFKIRARELNIASDAELEAYARKYADCNIPEEWQEYINTLKESDTKGGLAKQNDDKVDSRLAKILDSTIDVADYFACPYKRKGYTGTYLNCVKVERYDLPDLWIVYNFNVQRYTSSYYSRRGKLQKYYAEYVILTADPNTEEGQKQYDVYSNWHRDILLDDFKHNLPYWLKNQK
ncbi:MAG: hypothetical protein [Wendovervirus sonii]|uniref:Uncharacterized protein n=1 Tax=phage Lak_Megaphage_Sonny TaxID=3109229 RepID=A0ABZ0Z2T6_9CAUD|nr:MAG: hypothetical protein [phage Lak_Megaphage_Sonny]